jgi:putative endonuclease
MSQGNYRSQLGTKGEEIAACSLKKSKFSIIQKNFRTRLGEIDIIAQKGDVIVFVEVKTRKSRNFPILETISLTKQKRVIRAAQQFILRNNISDKSLRFDVITVLMSGCRREVSHIENAFTALPQL